MKRSERNTPRSERRRGTSASDGKIPIRILFTVLMLLLLTVAVGCSISNGEAGDTEDSTNNPTESVEKETTDEDGKGPILSDPATIEDVESKLTELYGLTDFDIVSVTVDTVDSPEHEGSIMEILVICHANGEETSWVESYGISYSTYLSLYQLNDSNTVYDWTDPYTELPLEAWGLILSIIEE